MKEEIKWVDCSACYSQFENLKSSNLTDDLHTVSFKEICNIQTTIMYVRELYCDEDYFLFEVASVWEDSQT
jgi:hypothetical protein